MSKVSQKDRESLVRFYQSKLADPFIDVTTKVLIEETIKIIKESLDV